MLVGMLVTDYLSNVILIADTSSELASSHGHCSTNACTYNASEQNSNTCVVLSPVCSANEEPDILRYES
jgi:hypothetical protein